MNLNEGIIEYCSKLEGWSSEAKMLALANIIVENKVDTSVEIGVWGGRGLISMAMAHRQLEHQGYPKTCAYGIDPWAARPCVEGKNDKENDEWWGKQDFEKIYADFIFNVAAHHLRPWCVWFRQRADQAIARFKPNSIGLLHQDGNHSAEVSQQEVNDWWPLIKPGGFLVADDTLWPSLQDTQKLILSKGAILTSDNGDWRIYQKPR